MACQVVAEVDEFLHFGFGFRQRYAGGILAGGPLPHVGRDGGTQQGFLFRREHFGLGVAFANQFRSEKWMSEHGVRFSFSVFYGIVQNERGDNDVTFDFTEFCLIELQREHVVRQADCGFRVADKAAFAEGITRVIFAGAGCGNRPEVIGNEGEAGNDENWKSIIFSRYQKAA